MTGRCFPPSPPDDRRRRLPNPFTSLPVESSTHAFAYIFEGSGSFRDASAPRAVRTEWVGEAGAAQELTGNRSLVLFDSGDEVTVLPRGLAARVRAVQVHDEPVEHAVAGQRVALNLSGVSVHELRRGDVVSRRGSALAGSCTTVRPPDRFRTCCSWIATC